MCQKCQKITIFEDSICSEQDVSEMPTHQIRFDDGIFFLITLITPIFNHGSQLDPHQLVNILLPFNKNPDSDIVGRKCTIQPSKAYQPVLLKLLQYTYCMCKRVNDLMKDSEETLGHMDVCLGKALFEVFSSYDTNTRKCTIQPSKAYQPVLLKLLQYTYCMCKRVNDLMKDSEETLGHMDVCLGKALFEVFSSYDTNTKKGRNELFKLFFDKKVGAIGGIYEDMNTFKIKHPQVQKIFENAIEQLI